MAYTAKVFSAQGGQNRFDKVQLTFADDHTSKVQKVNLKMAKNLKKLA